MQSSIVPSCDWAHPGATVALGLQGLGTLECSCSTDPLFQTLGQVSRAVVGVLCLTACRCPRLGADLMAVMVHPMARHSAKIQRTPFHNCARLAFSYGSLCLDSRQGMDMPRVEIKSDTSMILGVATGQSRATYLSSLQTSVSPK